MWKPANTWPPGQWQSAGGSAARRGFVLSCAMAFATGTSWGTFGIMPPLAGDMAAASDISLMLPMLAAVLAGSVFGDHSSPSPAPASCLPPGPVAITSIT
jgi:H+/gluconate symporter-like permease